ncbi:ATP-binding protein [Desulfobacterales bacterium HSG2]|nr:ATP-binding protein [Desulfobacterales bacterium HSG2]
MPEKEDFFDREAEEEALRKILLSKPNLVNFIYGPINTGKTTLLTRILEDLPDEFRVFYFNFRGVEIRKYEDFVRAMFRAGKETFWDKIRSRSDSIGATLDWMEKVCGNFNEGFVLPANVIKTFVGEKKNSEKNRQDVFDYLYNLFKGIIKRGCKPVLVLDELQMLRELRKNGIALHDMFNFMVRLTKETHVAHCLAVTSDSLFIEEIYGNARLEGRSRNFLIDDLDKERSYDVYEAFGFQNKELVWNYIGGKPGDMIRLNSELILGSTEKEGLELMLTDERSRLENLLEKVQYRLFSEDKIAGTDVREILEVLSVCSDDAQMHKGKIKPMIRRLLIEENFLFLDPVTGTVRPQGQLIRKAMKSAKVY